MIGLVVHLATASSSACSFGGAAVLQVDPDAEDDTPPATPILVNVAVRRGQGWRNNQSTSCDDIGQVVLTVARPDGDPDSESAVGYRFRILDGTLPKNLTVPTQRNESSRPKLGPRLALRWVDGDTDEQEPFAMTLEVIPVDIGGNEGTPLVVQVAHGGSTMDPACATSPTGPWKPCPLPADPPSARPD